MTTIHTFNFPTRIHFGPGARLRIREDLQAQGRERPLIVTDRGLAALPVFAEVLGSLSPLAATPFSGVAGNPVASQVVAGVEAFRAHEADSIVGIGGGGGPPRGPGPARPAP